MGVSVALSEVDTSVQVLANGPLSLSGKNMLVNAVLGHGDSSVTAKAVAGGLGGKVGVAPRLFLRKLVGDVLDRVDLHESFDPRQHYSLTLAESEMTVHERAASSDRTRSPPLTTPGRPAQTVPTRCGSGTREVTE
jgi:hypothetical protein